MGDLDQVLRRPRVALGQVAGDSDRTVPAPGAADGHDEVRLALGSIGREQVVQQRVQPLVEALEVTVAIDEADDPVGAGRVRALSPA